MMRKGVAAGADIPGFTQEFGGPVKISRRNFP